MRSGQAKSQGSLARTGPSPTATSTLRSSRDKYHMSPGPVSIHYTLLQTLDINIITNFNCPPFTVIPIWVELSSPSYFEIAVPNDPRRSSPPDAKVEVAATLQGVRVHRGHSKVKTTHGSRLQCPLEDDGIYEDPCS
jgi:hypothetical protein